MTPSAQCRAFCLDEIHVVYKPQRVHNLGERIVGPRSHLTAPRQLGDCQNTSANFVGTHSDDPRRSVNVGPLLHCAAARANYFIWVVPPENSHGFAVSHYEALWWCLTNILAAPVKFCAEEAREAATLPLAFGGLGLRSARRTLGQLGRLIEHDLEASSTSGGNFCPPVGKTHRVISSPISGNSSGAVV